jgi:hypothetical protein
MAFNQAAIIAGRDFKVYRVPFSTTNIIPADTVTYGTAWGTPAGQSAAYVEVGYTVGGLHFLIEITRGEIRVDQEVDPVLRPVTGRNMNLNSNLAEFTPANIQTGAGQGTITTVAAGGGLRGHDDLDITGVVADNYYTIGYDILHQGDGEAFRIIGWKMQPGGGVTGDITPEAAALVQMNMSAFPDTSTDPDRILKIRDISPIAA